MLAIYEYIWYSEEEIRWDARPLGALFAAWNETAHSSTVGGPTALFYNGQLYTAHSQLAAH